jgi:hypothetical protein
VDLLGLIDLADAALMLAEIPLRAWNIFTYLTGAP